MRESFNRIQKLHDRFVSNKVRKKKKIIVEKQPLYKRQSKQLNFIACSIQQQKRAAMVERDSGKAETFEITKLLSTEKQQ